MNSRNPVLIYGELQEGTIAPVTLELLCIGRTLADALSGELSIVFLGSGLSELVPREAIMFGADKVYLVANPLLQDYQPDTFMAAMADVCRKLEPEIVLLSQTSLGRDLAPRLAFRLGADLVTDCVKLEIDKKTGLLVHTKPVYGGNILASYISEAKPQIATVRPRAMMLAQSDSSRQGEIITLAPPQLPAPRTKLISRAEDKEGAGKKLEAAQVIVCGGRGVGSADNFRYLQELAHLLNGAVGASRPPCDLGWTPCELQIGLSGKIVAPSVYITVGVSGSTAHLAGCSNSKNIIAINTDPEANIFSVAHYGIVGDFRKVLPVIIETCQATLK